VVEADLKGDGRDALAGLVGQELLARLHQSRGLQIADRRGARIFPEPGAKFVGRDAGNLAQFVQRNLVLAMILDVTHRPLHVGRHQLEEIARDFIGVIVLVMHQKGTDQRQLSSFPTLG
jgi:hypothetical protein